MQGDKEGRVNMFTTDISVVKKQFAVCKQINPSSIPKFYIIQYDKNDTRTQWTYICIRDSVFK